MIYNPRCIVLFSVKGKPTIKSKTIIKAPVSRYQFRRRTIMPLTNPCGIVIPGFKKLGYIDFGWRNSLFKDFLLGG